VKEYRTRLKRRKKYSSFSHYCAMTSEGLCGKACVILYKCVGQCSFLHDGNFLNFFFQYCWKQKIMKSIRIVCNFTHSFFFTFFTMLAIEEGHLASCFFHLYHLTVLIGQDQDLSPLPFLWFM
jgi:hypothetical protein